MSGTPPFEYTGSYELSQLSSNFRFSLKKFRVLFLLVLGLLAVTVLRPASPARIVTVFPPSNYTGASADFVLTASFSTAVDSDTVNGNTFQLRDSANRLVRAEVRYNATTKTASLHPLSPLKNNAVYTATLVGDSAGIRDVSGKAVASTYSWSFSTAGPPAPPLAQGAGGPILVITDSSKPTGTYLTEILRAEGLNLFATCDISKLTSALLDKHQVVLLSETDLTASQASLISRWVYRGGTLIAMRPDRRLSGTLGLIRVAGTLSDAYLAVDGQESPGAGIVEETMQFHGTADLYRLRSARVIATLYSDSSNETQYPAVTQNRYGRGVAAAFTYDLARSVINTRQGNPAWAGQARSGQREGNGGSVIRADDLFFGPTSFDPEPNYVDLKKVAIPQADEQQRLLANMILLLNPRQMPLPRFWYFPHSFKAAIVLTGDDHGALYGRGGGVTAARFNQLLAYSPAGCSVADWQCVRATAYLVVPAIAQNPLTDEQVAAYTGQGFEVSLHLDTNCTNWNSSMLDSFYTRELSEMSATYPSMHAPRTHRAHCVSWSDYDSQPITELKHGIRMDDNYYYYPPAWVNDVPGMFTGSGLPMRFADRNGNLIDVYQATTQMTDESGQTYPNTVDTLLDNAVGPKGYYGFFTANVHNDHLPAPSLKAIIVSAKARGVPIISAEQLLTWWDGRNASSFNSFSWKSGALTFGVSVGAGANGLQTMLPINCSAGMLTKITRNGVAVSYRSETIKGIQYAVFTAVPGSYVAKWELTTPIS